MPGRSAAVRELRTPRLRVRGFQARPSVVVLLRTLERTRPALAHYQRAMAARTA